MESKIKIGLRCLYGAIAINMASALFYSVRMFQTYRNIDSGSVDWLAVTGTFGMYQFIVLVLGVVFADKLKKDDPWGWVGSLLILFVTLPSYAFPVAVIGLLNLLDSRVRDVYIEKLDIKLV